MNLPISLERLMSRVRQASLSLLVFALVAAPPELRAQTIPNPSFESNTFANPPGFVSDNAAITGWTASPTDKVGLNPAGGSNPFADNGVIPNGTRVAFIQSDGGVASTLSTTITGLVTGKTYRVQFWANCRSTLDPPSPSYRLNGGPPVHFFANTAVGGSNPYLIISGIFSATGTTAVLEISNTTPGDSTLLVDNFTISAATSLQVTNANNDGPGSLRQTLIAAAANPACNLLTFAPGLNGATITLLSEILIDDASGVVIDASTLSNGITIDGGTDNNRIFHITTRSVVSLRRLTLANAGWEVGGPDLEEFWGGAVHNSGALALQQCTLAGNSAQRGGAIFNWGSISLSQCTLSDNHAADGGGLYNEGLAPAGSGRADGVILTQCTLSGNTAIAGGGGVSNNTGGLMTLHHCTLWGNEADTNGGGIYNFSSKVTIDRSIVFYNPAPDVAEVHNDGGGEVELGGLNIIKVINSVNVSTVTGTGTSSAAYPMLAGLANNGGPTKTIALLPGSPARNAAIGSTITTDQRGKPKVGTADIGAFEVQAGGIFAFSHQGYEHDETDPFLGYYPVNETAGPAILRIKRGTAFDGTATVKISTTTGTASAADFTGMTNQVVSFADGEDVKDVPITLNNDGLVEANESFTVTLSSPSAGAVLGSPVSAKVTIIDPSALGPFMNGSDIVNPNAPVIASPAANATVTPGSDGKIIVSGTASDNKGVHRVLIQVTTGGSPSTFTDCVLDTPDGTTTGWTASIVPKPGLNTVEVQSSDNTLLSSVIVSRSFRALGSLLVQIAGNGSVTPPGYSPSSFREVGLMYSITATPAATPAPGSIFKNWEIKSAHTLGALGIPAGALEKPTLNFIHREGLILRANFVTNPYALGANLAAPGLGTNSAGVSGVDYCGLIHADPMAPAPNGTPPNNSTEGLFKATVMSTGAFSGSLTIDGSVLSMAGAFDHNGVARFGTSRTTTITVARANNPSLVVDLKIDLDGMRAKDMITGKVTAKGFQQSVTSAVSKVTADRAFYDGLTPATTVPAAYLGTSNATQSYTMVLPSRRPFNTANVHLMGDTSPSHENHIIEEGDRLNVGDQISFPVPAPLGLTAGKIYTLVDDDDLSPNDRGFSLKDSNDNFPDINNSYAGELFTVIVEHFTVTPSDDPEFQKDPDLVITDFPQGDGYGFLTITKAGLVTLTAGKLADGSGWTTTSAKLSKDKRFPLFLPLYNKLGYLSGDVALDNSNSKSDFAVANQNLDWLRPYDPTQHYYPYGWATGIRVGFMGARYATSFAPVSSVLRISDGGDADQIGDALPPPDPDNGNAGLSFFDGQLTEELLRFVSITGANAVANVPANDTTFTLALTAATGLFKGKFVHENDDGVPVPLKTDYEGVIYQKGTGAGGYGFFLTRKPTPIDYTGESGAVNLFGFGP